jgi:hypothetical protein
VRLPATALNNLGVGAIIAGIVGPLVNGHLADAAHVLTWACLGADLFALARTTLGRLRS